MCISGKSDLFLFWAGKTGIKISLVDLSPPSLQAGIFSSPSSVQMLFTTAEEIQLESVVTEGGFQHCLILPNCGCWDSLIYLSLLLGFWLSWAIEKKCIHVRMFEYGSAKSVGGVGITSAGLRTGKMLADTGRNLPSPTQRAMWLIRQVTSGVYS